MLATLLPACAVGGSGAENPTPIKLAPASIVATGKALGVPLEQLPGEQPRLRGLAKSGALTHLQDGNGWLQVGDNHHTLHCASTDAAPHRLIGARITINRFEADEAWQDHAQRFGLQPDQLVGVIQGTGNSFRNANGWLGVYSTQRPNWFACIGTGRWREGHSRVLLNELIRMDSDEAWSNRTLVVSGYRSWQQVSAAAQVAIAAGDGRGAIATLAPFASHLQPQVSTLFEDARECQRRQEERLRVPTTPTRTHAALLENARSELRAALANGKTERAAAWARLGQRHEPRALLWWQIGEIRARMTHREPRSIVRLCTEALNSRPDDADRVQLLRLRASAHAELQQADEAIGDAHAVLDLRPDDDHAQRLLHSLTAQQLRHRIYAYQRRQLEQQVADAPTDASAQIALATVLLETGEDAAAIKGFARAAELEATALTPALWLQYADLLGSRGNYDAGLDALQRAKQAHPTAADEFAPLSDLLLDKFQASVPTAAEPDSPDSSPVAAPARAKATLTQWRQRIDDISEQAERIGATADQLAKAQKLLEAPFANPEKHTDWAQLAQQWNQHAEAMQANEGARQQLAELGTKLANELDQQRSSTTDADSEALKALDSQLYDARSTLYERTGADRFEAHAGRANVWRDSLAARDLLDQPEQLRSRLDTWLQVEPPPPLALAAKGLLLYRDRHLAQACMLLHGSLGSQPDHALASQAHEALRAMEEVARPLFDTVALLRSNGDSARATTIADQALLLSPHEASGYANRARAQAASGAWSSALADLSRAVALAPLDTQLRRERSRVAERNRRFDLCLDDAEALLAQEPGAASHKHREAVRELVLDLEGAWRDGARAMRLGGRKPASKRLYRSPWQNDLDSSCFSRRVGTAALAKASEHDIWGDLPWHPAKAHKDLVAPRLLELMRNNAPTSEWTKPPADADAELAHIWPGLSGFLHAEWLWANGNRKQARAIYRTACDDPDVPVRLAVLAAHRLRAAFARDGGTRDRGAILVPQDYATLDEAIRAATTGQTILLADGRYRSSLRCNKSLNIVGHGQEHTTIAHSGKHGTVSGRSPVTVTMRNLRLEGGPANSLDSEGHGIAAQASLALLSGTTRFESVRFGPKFRIWSTAGSLVELAHCSAPSTATAPSDAPLLTVRSRAMAWLDQCQIERGLVAREGGTVFAFGLQLDHDGQMLALGERSQIRLERGFVADHSKPALLAQDQGQIHVKQTTVRGSFAGERATPLLSETSHGKVKYEGLALLGHTTDIPDDEAATSFSMSAREGSQESTRVATIDELRQAIANRKPLIELARGVYETPGALEVGCPTALIAAEPGVILRGRVDQTRTLIETDDAARLQVQGIRFEFATARPHPTIAKAFELLRRPYNLYRCIAGQGRITCIDCEFALPVSTEKREQFAVLDCRKGAALLHRCTGGTRLIAREQAQVWLASSPVADITVRDGAKVVSSGNGKTRRIEVHGSSSQLDLLGCTRSGVDLVAIADDVEFAPRTARDRLTDGVAPEQLSQQLWAGAHKLHIGPLLNSGSTQEQHSVGTWLRAIDGYRDTLAAALILVEPNEDQRVAKIAKALLPLLQNQPERLYDFNWLSYSNQDRRIVATLQELVPQADRDWIRARATASWELGTKATEEQIDDYQPWIAARLKGEFSKEQVRDARANGYSIRSYRQHLARLEAERRRKEAAITAAKRSGDRNRLRAALLAFGGDRYARFLLDDSRTSDSEIHQGIALANDYRLVRRLQALKRTRQAAAAAQAAATRYPSRSARSYRSYGSSNSTSYRSNDFQQWHNRSQRWNRSMDRWISNFKSSQYNSYQNRY